MIDSENSKPQKIDEVSKEAQSKNTSEKGPLSFLSGALTSGLFSWMSLLLSQKVIIYFAVHSKTYQSPIAQSVASGLKTLVIGMCFLSTFTFGFIAIGLSIVFIRSLFDAKNKKPE